jgi:hypothetical protein
VGYYSHGYFHNKGVYMDLNVVLDYLVTLAPWVQNVFAVLGGVVVAGTAIDAVIPDEKDKGFMKKILEIPVVGAVLKGLKKFSPFNHK